MLHRDLERSSQFHAVGVVLLRLFVRGLNVVLVRGHRPTRRYENGVAVELFLIQVGDVFSGNCAVLPLIWPKREIAAVVGDLDDVTFDAFLAPVIVSDADDLLQAFVMNVAAEEDLRIDASVCARLISIDEQEAPRPHVEMDRTACSSA